MPAAAAVEPDKILRELRDQWEQLGRDQEPSGGVLRACAYRCLLAPPPGSPGDTRLAHHAWPNTKNAEIRPAAHGPADLHARPARRRHPAPV